MQPKPKALGQYLPAFVAFLASALAVFVIAGSGQMLRSTPYNSIDATADARLSSLTAGQGASILDGLVTKVRAKAMDKGGNPVNASLYTAYVDAYLAKVDRLDNDMRAAYGNEYAFLFQYIYPRVRAIRVPAAVTALATSCEPRPTSQYLADYNNYSLQYYLEIKCADLPSPHTPSRHTSLEGTIQVSWDAKDLVCDASTNYKWVFPSPKGLIPNGKFTCKLSDKCLPVPASPRAGRTYTQTRYGYYVDEIVKTCTEAGKGTKTGVYMEGSYPKCWADTGYKWTNLAYSEIGNSCDSPAVTTVGSAPAPVSFPSVQCNQAKSNGYKALKFSNGNVIAITSIIDCGSAGYEYMTAGSPTSIHGQYAQGDQFCNEIVAPATTPPVTTVPVSPTSPTTSSVKTSSYSRVIEYYMCGSKEKDANGAIKWLKSVASYDKSQFNASSRPIGIEFDMDEYGRPNGSFSEKGYGDCANVCAGVSSNYSTLCGLSKIIQSSEDTTMELPMDKLTLEVTKTQVRSGGESIWFYWYIPTGTTCTLSFATANGGWSYSLGNPVSVQFLVKNGSYIKTTCNGVSKDFNFTEQ